MTLHEVGGGGGTNDIERGGKSPSTSLACIYDTWVPDWEESPYTSLIWIDASFV